MSTYKINLPDLNINGKMVKVNDMGGIIEASCIKEQDKIKKIDEKVKAHEASQLAYSKLLNLNSKFKMSCNQLRNANPYGASTSVFDEKLAVASGMTPETMVSYFDIDVNTKASLGLVKIEVDKVAVAEKWRSKSFTSRLSSVTQATSSTDPNMFKAGTFQVKIQNNSKKFVQNFSYTSAVNHNVSGYFNDGKFQINGIDINIANNDSLAKIAATINNSNSGVQAILIDDDHNKKSLTLNSENEFIITDPDKVFENLTQTNGQHIIDQKDSVFRYSKKFVQSFDLYPIAVSESGNSVFRPGIFYINNKAIVIHEGDNLSIIAKKITSSKIGVDAKVETGVNGEANLIIRSSSFGAEHDYFIDDPYGILSSLNNNGGNYLEKFTEYEDITLNQGDSLTTITSKINNIKDRICLKAELAEVNRGNIRMLLSSTNTGIDNRFEIKDQGQVLNGQNTTNIFQTIFQDGLEKNGTTPYNHLVVAANDAQLKIDDIEISRPTNKISDFRDGLTVTVKQPSSRAMHVNIIPYTEGIVKSMQNFVNQYNDLLKFITKQRQKDENGKPVENAYLADSDILKKQELEMKLKSTILVQADIGITSITLPEDITKDDKKEPKYSGILELNIPILVQSLSDDIQRIQKIFDYDFESTSPDFSIPSNRKNTVVSLNGVNINVDSYDIDLDKSKATVQSTTSVGFDSDQTPIVSATPTAGKFTAGLFYINDKKITLEVGQSLNDIVKTINSVSPYSRISSHIITKNNKYFLELTLYQGSDSRHTDKSKFENISFYDPDNICSALFQVKRETLELQNNNPFQPGSFKINDVDVIINDSSISNFVQAINNQEHITGVNAKSDINPQGHYKISLFSTKLRPIIIDDNQDNVFNNTLVEVSSNDASYFWNTSRVCSANVRTSRGTFIKKMTYELANRESLDSGFFHFNNIDDVKLKVYDLSLAYIGNNAKEKVSIIANQGVAEWFANYIDNLNGSIYNGNNSEIQREVKGLENKKDKLALDKKRQQDNLERTQQNLRRQYAVLNAGIESMTQQLQLLDVINNPNGD